MPAIKTGRWHLKQNAIFLSLFWRKTSKPPEVTSPGHVTAAAEEHVSPNHARTYVTCGFWDVSVAVPVYFTAILTTQRHTDTFSQIIIIIVNDVILNSHILYILSDKLTNN